MVERRPLIDWLTRKELGGLFVPGCRKLLVLVRCGCGIFGYSETAALEAGQKI